MPFHLGHTFFIFWQNHPFQCNLYSKKKASTRSYYATVKLGGKEHFDKEQIGVKELFTDYQLFYAINLLLDKELLPI